MSIISNKAVPMTDFLKLDPQRNQIIESASDAEPKPLLEHKANSIAKALHPDVQHLKVSEVIERTPDTKSFVLVADPENGTDKIAYFQAGQYLAVSLQIGDAKLTRPYSISSSPKEASDGFYMLTIKRVDGGLASQYILDNWKVGSSVVTSAPLGEFTYEPLRDAKTIIGLAGGSGITPFYSLAKAIRDGDEDAEMILLYGSRTLDDALFLEDFKQIETECDSFRLINVLSDSEAEGCEKGFITADLIKKYAPDGDYSIFLCGPQAMYNFVDKEIATLGLRKKFIRHELFGEFHDPQSNDDYPVCQGSQFALKVKQGGKDYKISCAASETLLVAMEKAGISAPSRCRSGVCGWCHSRLISGEVYIPKTVDGRRLADIDYGYVHPCCTFPLSDVELDVPPFKA